MINKIKQSIAYILIGTLGVIGLVKSAGSSQDAVPKELTPEDKKLVDTVRAVGDFDLSQERFFEIRQKDITLPDICAKIHNAMDELHYAFMLEKNRVEKILPREGVRPFGAFETWSDYWNHNEGRPKHRDSSLRNYGQRFITFCGAFCDESISFNYGKPPLTDFQVLEELKRDTYLDLTMNDLEYKKFILSGLWDGYVSNHGDIYPFEFIIKGEDLYTAKPLGTKPLIPYLRAFTLLARQLDILEFIDMPYKIKCEISEVISVRHFNEIIDNILASLRKDDDRYEDLRTLDQKVNNAITDITIRTRLATTCRNFHPNHNPDMAETHNPWYLSLSDHYLLNQDASPASPVEPVLHADHL